MHINCFSSLHQEKGQIKVSKKRNITGQFKYINVKMDFHFYIFQSVCFHIGALYYQSIK